MNGLLSVMHLKKFTWRSKMKAMVVSSSNQRNRDAKIVHVSSFIMISTLAFPLQFSAIETETVLHHGALSCFTKLLFYPSHVGLPEDMQSIRTKARMAKTSPGQRTEETTYNRGHK
jgi:hypothetical protein